MTFDQQQKNKFGLGLILGTIIGGIATFFLSPKSGEDNRKEISKKMKDVLENTKDTAGDLYDKAQKEVTARMNEFNENIDEGKYGKMVNEVLSDMKHGIETSRESIENVREKLMKDWRKLEKTSRKKK